MYSFDTRAGMFALVLMGGGSLAGCKSAADKCRDDNRELYGKKAQECKDEACKKQVAEDLKNYLESCDRMK